MGSWDENCMITRLPITLGDEVYVAVILPSKRYKDDSRLYYSDDLYKFVFRGIKCKYNDYGCGTGYKDINDKEIKKFIKNGNLKLGDEEHKYEETFEGFINCVERGDCTFEEQKLTLCWFHKDVYEKIINTFPVKLKVIKDEMEFHGYQNRLLYQGSNTFIKTLDKDSNIKNMKECISLTIGCSLMRAIILPGIGCQNNERFLHFEMNKISNNIIKNAYKKAKEQWNDVGTLEEWGKDRWWYERNNKEEEK